MRETAPSMTVAPEPGATDLPPSPGEAWITPYCSRCGRPAEPGRPRCAPCAEIVGAAVTRKLMATPGVHKLPTRHLEMFLMRDFLDEADCARLIALIDADRVPSGILADHPDPQFRTSESCNLRRDNPFVQAIEDRITAVMGIDPRYGETIQGQRYDVSQQFKAHHDFFYQDQGYWEQEKVKGGQRTWTAMIFLNEPEAGGKTYFPKAGARIAPRRGNLLIWNNLDPRGLPNMNSLHEGMAVESGLKYVITKWYRERPWGIRPPARAKGGFRVQVKKGARAKK